MTALSTLMKHCLLMLSFCSFLTLNATSYVWDGGAGSNNWTHANNWNPNGVPGASDLATISGVSVIIPSGSNISLQKLTLSSNGVLTIQANASLTISGGSQDRRIQIDGIGANLTNNGTLSLSNSTLMGIYMKNGSFTNNGNATISYSGSHGGMEMRENSNFTNNGNITIQYVTDGDAIHQIESTAVVYNYGYMHFHHLHDGIFGYAGTKFYNYGDLDIFYHDIENIAEVLIDGEGGLDFYNYAGATVRGDGEIGPDVFIHSGGTVDPTDDTGEGIGIVNFYCNSTPCVDQNFANSILVVDIEGTAGGGVLGGHDKFTFSHQANFASTTVFDVNFGEIYNPQSGHTFVIMTYPSKSGTPSFNLPALPSGLSWNTSVTNTQITVSITGSGGQVCTPNLVLQNMTIQSGTYLSAGQLTARAASIANNGNVIFKSDTGILLEYDFTVPLGASLDAIIQTCPQN